MVYMFELRHGAALHGHFIVEPLRGLFEPAIIFYVSSVKLLSTGFYPPKNTIDNKTTPIKLTIPRIRLNGVLPSPHYAAVSSKDQESLGLTNHHDGIRVWPPWHMFCRMSRV